MKGHLSDRDMDTLRPYGLDYADVQPARHLRVQQSGVRVLRWSREVERAYVEKAHRAMEELIASHGHRIEVPPTPASRRHPLPKR